MRSDGSGRAAQWTLAERAESPRFILKFTRMIAAKEPTTPKEQIDEYIRAMSERPADPDGGTMFALRSRREFALGDVPAAVVYATIREADGLSAVQGYYLLQIAPAEFIVISALLAEEDFAAVAPLLERSLQTAHVLGDAEVAEVRRARVERADAFLRMLDEESLRSALDRSESATGAPQPRWFRLGRALPDGTEQEVGYMTVLAIEAPQGAANPDRDPAKWDALEREPGLLVRIRVRTLLDEKGTQVADTDGRYWVRWDRQREFWTSRSTQRAGKRTRTTTQLGVREAPTPGAPRPALEIADSSVAAVDAKPRRLKVPDAAYLSLAEALVLPRLLARIGDPGDYAFNWFDPRSDRPTQRRDQMERTETGFVLLSSSTPEAPPTRQVLGKRGELLRLDADDGGFTQAIEPLDLVRLWSQKGLPTE
jgi:hypothetical protein